MSGQTSWIRCSAGENRLLEVRNRMKREKKMHSAALMSMTKVDWMIRRQVAEETELSIQQADEPMRNRWADAIRRRRVGQVRRVRKPSYTQTNTRTQKKVIRNVPVGFLVAGSFFIWLLINSFCYKPLTDSLLPTCPNSDSPALNYII